MPNPGTTWTYDYTGKEQVFSVPVSGIYKLEVWGASGGCSLTNGTTTCSDIGYGGYSTAMVSLNRNSLLYTNVGGKGTNGALGKNASGGYNGGGYGTWDNNDDETSGGGGGATHIATSSGLLSTLKNNIDNILIVAGGGGGKSWTYVAGSGGGFKGVTTQGTNQSEVSQTKGYAFGQGQNASGVADQDGVGGGGGGFYGGYMNNVAGKSSGSGGSGYIGNTNLTNRTMYCYKCEQSSDESTKTISTTNVSEQAISQYAKNGNGYAKITLLVNSDYALESDKTNPTVKVSISGKVATFTFSDNAGISGYGVNQSNTEEPDYISTNDLNATWTATSSGTYYVWVKDMAGNKINYLFKINDPLYLYNYGTTNSSLTGGFGYTGLGYGYQYSTTGTSYSFNSNNIYLSSGASSTNNVDISVTTNKSINTEGYSKLYITSSHNRSGCNYAYGTASIAISEKRYSNVRDNYSSYSAIANYYNGNNVVGTVSIDLTNFQGNYYIALFNYYSGSSNIYSVWME